MTLLWLQETGKDMLQKATEPMHHTAEVNQGQHRHGGRREGGEGEGREGR